MVAAEEELGVFDDGAAQADGQGVGEVGGGQDLWVSSWCDGGGWKAGSVTSRYDGGG